MAPTTAPSLQPPTKTIPFLVLLAATIIVTNTNVVASKNEEEFLFGGCTQIKYTPDSPYEWSLNSLVTSLVNSATYSSYNHFTVTGSSRNDVVYGLYQCRGDLSMPDCAACVARAASRAGDLCPGACGAAVQLQGCYAKYDNVSFLGVEDKTVVLKKCGPSVGYRPGPMGRRDAVMGALVGTGGPFRVGGSGDVQGVAQCTGDLGVGECQDCVAEAIGRLKSDCGTADFGDMFLAKCYARYNTGGDGPSYDSSAHSGTDGNKSTNDGEKTFAIIIGLLAGVALLIIFLIFIRKICEGNGK